MYDVIVIGAGQAGLASAYALQQAGLDYLVLEASDRATGSWPKYYASLKLFSPARHSSLPGLNFPGDPERYPLRDEVVQYLEAYARHYAFPISYHAHILQVTKQGDHFNIQAEDGRTWQARTIISATGPFNQPNIPQFEGMHEFKGQILHSAYYRHPSDIVGERVAVVGAGNSAVQIAHELTQTHKVVLTARQAPQFLRQRLLGRDIHDWLVGSGLDTLPLGRWFGWSPATSVLDPGMYRRAFANGTLSYRPLFDRMTTKGLAWDDQVEHFDTVLMATGFIHQPAYLEGLDGLSAVQAAQQKGGQSLAVPGLYFVGTSWQQSNASATLRGVGKDARKVATAIAHFLKKNEPFCLLCNMH